MYTKVKSNKKDIQQRLEDNILSRQEKIKMLTRR